MFNHVYESLTEELTPINDEISEDELLAFLFAVFYFNTCLTMVEYEEEVFVRLLALIGTDYKRDGSYDVLDGITDRMVFYSDVLWNETMAHCF